MWETEGRGDRKTGERWGEREGECRERQNIEVKWGARGKAGLGSRWGGQPRRMSDVERN